MISQEEIAKAFNLIRATGLLTEEEAAELSEKLKLTYNIPIFRKEPIQIGIYMPPDDVCPWGHSPIIKHPTDKTYGQMLCTVCGESFQSR